VLRLYEGSIKALLRLFRGSIRPGSFKALQASLKALSGPLSEHLGIKALLRLYQGSFKALSRLY
jgi:hypothetical protein